MKKILSVFTAFLILLSLSGCEGIPKRYSQSWFDVFDTAAEFTAYCRSEEEFDRLCDVAHSELKRLHEIFDIYNEYGFFNARSLNLQKSGDCPPELCEVINLGIEWHKLSGGQLNIALGSVLELWHDCREAGVLPDGEELTKRSQHCDISKIEINGSAVTLADPEMSLDYGALAKGWAVEKTAEALCEAGAENFMLSVGGNVVARGEKPSGEWTVGVESPDGGILTSFNVKDGAVVTSGDYQRCYEVDGVVYHHIIDPKTLWPAGLWRSVTVADKSSAEADALSTALFCLSYEDGKALLEKTGAEALWVSKDGEITRSEGFPDEN